MEWAVRIDVARIALSYLADAGADADASRVTLTVDGRKFERLKVNRTAWLMVRFLEHPIHVTSSLRSDGSDAAEEEAYGGADSEAEQETNHDAFSSGSSPSSRRRCTISETR
jgi:hypothetical protein